MTTRNDKIVYIFNRNAGNGIRNLEKRIADQTKALKHDPIIAVSESREESTDIINHYYEVTDGKFVVVGGDGTMNSVGELLLQKKGKMGLIPAGSGNGLARYLNIPLNVEKAVERAINGQEREIDVWKINDNTFINVAGLGFDAEIAKLFAKRENKGFWGYTSYVTSTVFSYKSNPFELELNNTTITGDYFLVAFFNGSQYGNNAVIAPTASASDGYVNLVGVPKMDPLQIFDNLYRCMVSHSGLKNALEEEIETISIKSDIELPLHVDGEFCGYANSFKLEKDKRQLVVIT